MPRGGKKCCVLEMVFERNEQKVQGGEPPPSPRSALPLDLAVAFHKNQKTHNMEHKVTTILRDMPSRQLPHQPFFIEYIITIINPPWARIAFFFKRQ